ncbi:hypothetical protein LAZ67_7000126 [Cordylochernes scorpioides]|uniref:Uncharacterized protein n=1 Tax=Cordylochernes scorpioides TaxID=51811 RepID=A0ABY6KPH8_9ARAC|nr:hypothetical protein LAZ67_7000126 [Cordylochernes scorpioides]
MKASTKYLNRKCRFIRQIVEDEEIVVLHIPSEEMKADHLTKTVDAVKLKNCISAGSREREASVDVLPTRGQQEAEAGLDVSTESDRVQPTGQR